jgi:cellulose synthase/poly-beta-1,6-N-acetylglucosamine synthase-like glycosyltransferase
MRMSAFRLFSLPAHWFVASLSRYFRVHSSRMISTMPAITALLHTKNDAIRLGRVLETLYPCDEILIVDHNSSDATVKVAREYGARIVEPRGAAAPTEYLDDSHRGWILCLDPRESLTESLAASLFELKSESKKPEKSASFNERAFSVLLREETAEGWIDHPAAQTRLVPVGWKRWEGKLPANEPSAVQLHGELLRFAFP